VSVSTASTGPLGPSVGVVSFVPSSSLPTLFRMRGITCCPKYNRVFQGKSDKPHFGGALADRHMRPGVGATAGYPDTLRDSGLRQLAVAALVGREATQTLRVLLTRRGFPRVARSIGGSAGCLRLFFDTEALCWFLQRRCSVRAEGPFRGEFKCHIHHACLPARSPVETPTVPSISAKSLCSNARMRCGAREAQNILSEKRKA